MAVFNRQKLTLLTGAALLSAALAHSSGYCQDSTSAGTATTPSADNPSVAAASPAPAPLTGGVQRVILNMSVLQEIGLDLKRVLTGSKHLYDEVTIQPVSIMTEPEVVGMGTIINIPIGTTPVGPPVPPKKDRLVRAMAEMGPVIESYKTSMDAIIAGKETIALPDDIKQALQPQFATWKKDVNELDELWQQLQPLTQGPTFDNNAIAQVAFGIQENVKDLDKSRREMFKVMKKEAKEIDAYDRSLPPQ